MSSCKLGNFFSSNASLFPQGIRSSLRLYLTLITDIKVMGLLIIFGLATLMPIVCWLFIFNPKTYIDGAIICKKPTSKVINKIGQNFLKWDQF